MNRPRPTLPSRAIAAGVATIILMAGCTATAHGATSVRRCPSFSVRRGYTPTVEVTFSFSKIRAIGVSCRETRRLITQYLDGEGRPAGPHPTDGSVIDGWNVLVLASAASGHKGHAHFSAMYK